MHSYPTRASRRVTAARNCWLQSRSNWRDMIRLTASGSGSRSTDWPASISRFLRHPATCFIWPRGRRETTPDSVALWIPGLRPLCKWDRNGDGKPSRHELYSSPDVLARFSGMDRDQVLIFLKVNSPPLAVGSFICSAKLSGPAESTLQKSHLAYA